jgi:hypothetical protein
MKSTGPKQRMCMHDLLRFWRVRLCTLGRHCCIAGGVIVYRQERCVFSNKPRSYAGIIRYEEAGQCICRLGRVAWF